MRSFASNSHTVLGGYAPPKGAFRLVAMPEPTADAPRRHRFTLITEPGSKETVVSITAGDGADPIEVKLTKAPDPEPEPGPGGKKARAGKDDDPPAQIPVVSVLHDFQRAGEFDVVASGSDTKQTSHQAVLVPRMRLTMNLQPTNSPIHSDKHRTKIMAVVGGLPKAATVKYSVNGGTALSATAQLNPASKLHEAVIELDGTTIRGGFAEVTVTCDKYPGDTVTEIIAVPRIEEPIIASITVAGAPANTGLALAGGQDAIVEGTGLTGATKVEFGGTAATGLEAVSDILVRCKTPAGTKGKNYQDVTVTTPGGTFTKPRCFAYKDAVL